MLGQGRGLVKAAEQAQALSHQIRNPGQCSSPHSGHVHLNIRSGACQVSTKIQPNGCTAHRFTSRGSKVEWSERGTIEKASNPSLKTPRVSLTALFLSFVEFKLCK